MKERTTTRQNAKRGAGWQPAPRKGPAAGRERLLTVQGRRGDLRGFAWSGGGCHFEALLPPNAAQQDVLEAGGYCIPADPMNPPCRGRSGRATPESIAARSRHPGGVQATMCDRSGRFYSDNVNLDVWRGVSTAGGKETVGSF